MTTVLLTILRGIIIQFIDEESGVIGRPERKVIWGRMNVAHERLECPTLRRLSYLAGNRMSPANDAIVSINRSWQVIDSSTAYPKQVRLSTRSKLVTNLVRAVLES